MKSEILEEFLLEECSPYVRDLLLTALEAARSGSGPPKKRFEFNRFDVTLDFPGEVVVLEDVLDPSESGEESLSLTEFFARLKQWVL